MNIIEIRKWFSNNKKENWEAKSLHIYSRPSLLGLVILCNNKEIRFHLKGLTDKEAE